MPTLEDQIRATFERVAAHTLVNPTPSFKMLDRIPVQASQEEPAIVDLETPSHTDELQKRRKRVLVAGLLAAAVVAIALMAIRNDDPVSPADQPSTVPVPVTVPLTSPPPALTTEPTATAAATTSAPRASDLEVIEAGVAAFYSGDGERAAELFELADRTDDQIRAESAYQAAVGGRLDLSCAESTPGSFNCSTPYRNAMTDAIGEGGGSDVWPVVVEDGVITQFGFTEHSGLLTEMGTFLAGEGRFDGYEDCLSGPFRESCATIQLENLDAWAAWHETLEPTDRVEAVLKSWFGGNCDAAVLLSFGEIDCSASSVPAQTIAYESILGAQVSVEECETTSAGDQLGLSCEVHYSNAMNSAVGKPPSVIARPFVLTRNVLTAGLDEEPWYEVDYPEDTELRDSFRLFAEGGELAEEYADAGCASTRSPECANLIVNNLDAWATWYETNG
jgi:hypothetical protein